MIHTINPSFVFASCPCPALPCPGLMHTLAHWHIAFSQSDQNLIRCYMTHGWLFIKSRAGLLFFSFVAGWVGFDGDVGAWVLLG